MSVRGVQCYLKSMPFLDFVFMFIVTNTDIYLMSVSDRWNLQCQIFMYVLHIWNQLQIGEKYILYPHIAFLVTRGQMIPLHIINL